MKTSKNIHFNTPSPVEISENFKRFFNRIFLRLSNPSHFAIVGAQSFRWKPWYYRVAGFHLVKQKRFAMFNSAVIFPHRHHFLLWRTSLHFLYNFAFKRYPRVVFVGNSRVIPLTELVMRPTFTKLNEPITALDSWIPGYISNRGGVPLSLHRRLHYRLFLEAKKKFKRFRLMQVPGIGSFQSFYYPDLLIVLDSSFNAYNADIEVYRESVPAIFLGDTDSKCYGFSGAYFALAATTSSVRHLIYYMTLFLSVYMHGKQQFFFRERAYFDHFAERFVGKEEGSYALWHIHTINRLNATNEASMTEVRHSAERILQTKSSFFGKLFYRCLVWIKAEFWAGKRLIETVHSSANALSGIYLARKEFENLYESYFYGRQSLFLSLQLFSKAFFNLFSIMVLQAVYFRSGVFLRNKFPFSGLTIFRSGQPLGSIVYNLFKLLKLNVFNRPNISFMGTKEGISINDNDPNEVISRRLKGVYDTVFMQPIKKDIFKVLRIAQPLVRKLYTINKFKKKGWFGFGVFPSRKHFDYTMFTKARKFIQSRDTMLQSRLQIEGQSNTNHLRSLFPDIGMRWRSRRRWYRQPRPSFGSRFKRW